MWGILAAADMRRDKMPVRVTSELYLLSCSRGQASLVIPQHWNAWLIQYCPPSEADLPAICRTGVATTHTHLSETLGQPTRAHKPRDPEKRRAGAHPPQEGVVELALTHRLAACFIDRVGGARSWLPLERVS